MKATAFFLIGLIAFSSAFTSEFFQKHNIGEVSSRNIMDVMVQVEASIKAGNPFETVLGLLNKFKDAVNKEQIAHDDLYTAQKGECDGEIGFRVREVADATTVLKASTGQLNRCNVQKGKTNAELGTTSDQLIQYQQHLELIQQVRRAQQENFSRAAVVFNDALRALEDCVDLANQVQVGGASFAELADHTGKMMKQAVEIGKVNQYAAVLASMAKMSLAQQANQSDVERLVSLLGNLKTVLEDAYNDWVNANNESIQMFQQQKERIEGNVARLQQAEEALKAQLQQLNACVAQQTAVSQQATNKKVRNQKLLDDANSLCGTFESEYQAATAGRRQEMQVVAELEQLVRRRFSQVQQ